MDYSLIVRLLNMFNISYSSEYIQFFSQLNIIEILAKFYGKYTDLSSIPYPQRINIAVKKLLRTFAIYLSQLSDEDSISSSSIIIIFRIININIPILFINRTRNKFINR